MATDGPKRRSAAAPTPRREPFELAGTSIPAGRQGRLELRVARLVTGTWLSLPVTVVHGRHEGPSLCLCAAIHGDELNGVEIIRRVVATLEPDALRGTVVAVPIVNVFGLIDQSRYMPDRRDLNRSFPGSARGSLASQLANLFMTEVLSRCRYGIDFHTGSNHRTNLPQIRADLEHDETLELAKAFGVPVVVNAKLRDGSLRSAADRQAVPMLVYEGGEPNRFNEEPIAAGVQGTLRIMRHLKMIARRTRKAPPSVRADGSRWVRASQSGFFHRRVELGDTVGKSQLLGVVTDVFGEARKKVVAPVGGVIIGRTTHPLVNRGDALLHIAETPLPLE